MVLGTGRSGTESAAARRCRIGSQTDPQNESREPTLGRATHPRRTTQTRALKWARPASESIWTATRRPHFQTWRIRIFGADFTKQAE
jgi:hypothetical protein